MAGIVQTVVRAPESTQNIPLQPGGSAVNAAIGMRQVRDVAKTIAYLDPDSAPLTVVTMRGNSRPATNWKFEWAEKSLPARWDAINNGAGYASGATSLVVNNGKYFSVGDLVKVPRTGETMIVDAVATNTLTVRRGVGYDGTSIGFQAAALVDKDDLLIIGNAYQEGAVSGSVKTVQEDWFFNYTQIMRTPLSETNTEANTDSYFGKQRNVLRMEKGVEHRIDLERSCLFGERMLSTSGGSPADSSDAPRRYTGGLLYFLSELSTTAFTQDFGGLVTEAELENFAQNVFNVTGAGDTRTFVASPLWCSIFDQIAASRIQVLDRATTYGVTVRQFITSHGTLNIVKHRLLENNPAPTATSPSGYAGYALALDLSRLTYRPLQNRATKLLTDIQAPDADLWKDEYMTEFGWQVVNAKAHGIAKGATG